MRSLLEIQKTFLGALREDPAACKRMLSIIVPSRSISEMERFGVYAYAYLARLADSLAEDYSTVQRCLGADRFAKIASDFNKSQKNRHFNLNEYGKSFAQWLRKSAVRSPAYIADVAELDWLVVESFYAKEAPAEDQIDASKPFRLKLAPHARLMLSKWAIDALWSEKKKKLNAQSLSRFLVFRRNNLVSVRRIEKIEFDILSMLESGATLDKIASALPKNTKPQFLAEKFSEWKVMGLLSAQSVKMKSRKAKK